MAIITDCAENASILADRYMGTKYDVIHAVGVALPWLTTLLADVTQVNLDFQTMQENLARNEVIHTAMETMYGSAQEIQAVADYVEETQNNIEASIFDMGYNLIRTQAIVATHHTFV